MQRRILGIETAFGLTCISYRQPGVCVVDAPANAAATLGHSNITVMTMAEKRADLIRKS